MSGSRRGKLVIIAGPSCAGKTPLKKALQRDYPDLAAPLREIVLHNDRPPRPEEADGEDYHFRQRERIESLRDDNRYLVTEVRGDLQALDLHDLHELLEKGDALYEGNPVFGKLLLTHEALTDVPRLSVFVSPLSWDEVVYLREHVRVDERSVVTDVMRRRLLRRTRRQKGELSQPDLAEVERRAAAVIEELNTAHRYDHVIANHDGEDSENWDAFGVPLADARRTLLALAALLRGQAPDTVEHWPEPPFADA